MEQEYIISDSENGQIKSIKFLEGITKIKKESFQKCTSLEEIELPESLKEIHRSAFSGCTSLKHVKFSKNLEYINDYVFKDCTSLEEIELPEGLKKIGVWAFQDCTSLKHIKFSKNLEHIERRAFEGCTSLEEIELPENLKEIEEYAFKGCTSLKRIKFSKNLKYINDYVFSDCTSLEEIELPESLKEIEEYAFCDYTFLKRIKFSKNLEYIKQSAFQGCTSLEEIELPESLKEIKESAFLGCTSLKRIKFSKNIEYISKNAFRECTSLEEIELPENLKEIEVGAFYNCTSLKRIRFSKNLEHIDNWAFLGCTSLEEIELPESLKKIEEDAFLGCNSLKRIKFSNPNCFLPTKTFEGCDSIEILEFSENCNNHQFLLRENGEWPFMRYIRIWNLGDPMKDYSMIHLIILRYNNYEEFIQILKATYHDLSLSHEKIFLFYINIHLIGPQLSILQKIEMKKWLRKLHITNIKFVNRNTYQDTIKERMINTIDEKSEFDDEIKELLTRIDHLANELPNSSKDYISKLKQNLIIHYQEEKEREIPELDWNKHSLTFGNTNIGDARIKFIIQLNNIVLMLSHQEKILDLLFELKKYDNIFEMTPTNLVNNPTTIEEYLQNLIFLSSKIDDKKREEVLNQTKCYLEFPKQEYEKELKESLENKQILHFQSEMDPKTELLLQLSTLFNNTLTYYEQVSPYISFKNSLQSSNQLIESYLTDDSLESMLKNIRYLIHKITDETEKEKLNTLFNNLIKKYLKEIENHIHNEDLSNKEFINITSNFHKELNPILIWLNKIAIKEENTLEFKNELQYALESDETKQKEKHKHSVIDLFIIEINQIIEGNSFSIEEKENITLKIEELLKKYISITNDISSKTETEKITKELYSEFADIELIVRKYAHDKQEYTNIYCLEKKKSND